MVVSLHLRLENLVHEVERVDGLQQVVIFPAPDLSHVGFGGVEQYPVLELLRPDHLHLDDELPSPFVLAPHVNDAVFFPRVIGHHLCGEVLDVRDLLPGSERKQGVE